MVMYDKWSWCEYEGCTDREDEEYDTEEIFLHIIEIVIRSLGP